jgi:inorganic pyrophosphatase
LQPENKTIKIMISKYRAHPWHGISAGKDAPNTVTAYIEIVPTDTVKYEIDKESGFLKIDRPQKYSNIVPSLYGFIPQTYSGRLSAEYAGEKAGIKNLQGDGDPLDICVLTERAISHSDLLVQAVPIGGFRMIDNGEADDKIIAVLKNDSVYGSWKDIKDAAPGVIERLRHYFLTYKNIPGEAPRAVDITHVYGVEEAKLVIEKSIADYENEIANK